MGEIGTLPACGRRVVVREPAGADELLALDGAGSAVATVLALCERLVEGAGEWSELPAVDLAAAALLVRRVWIGRTVRTDASCPAAGCAERVDVSFDVDAYLAHHRPRAYRGVADDGSGWLALAGTEVRFRIPTVADLLEAPAARALAACCLRPAGAEAAVVRRFERALAALAPPLAGELGGSCPACGEAVVLWFEPIEYVLAELRDASVSLFGHVHELALAYHWSEPAILALDRRRRQGYVDLVRAELVA